MSNLEAESQPSATARPTGTTGTGERVIPDIAEIFREHAARVERTLLRLGVRESDVADATQEVFLVVHRKLHAFEGRASVSTWLYRIALRVASAQRRLARHRRELCSDEITGAAAADADLQAELEKRALLCHLSDAFERLSEPQRVVLALHELDEQPMHEVARRLGIPTKTAFSRVYAARRALAGELRRLGYAAPMWLPLMPSPSAWLEHAVRLDAMSGGGTGAPLAARATRLAWAQTKLPLAFAVCAALLCPPPQAETPAQSDRALAVAASGAVASVVDVQLAVAPSEPAPSSLESQPSRKRRAQPKHTVPSRLVVPATPEPPPEAASEFRAVRMGGEAAPPLLEHPFASRVRATVVVLPPLAARFAPGDFEATLPDYPELHVR